jgi:hypothetical protein
VQAHAETNSIGLLAGASASNARYIAYLPENVVVVKGWLFSLWSTFTAQSNVGMTVPLIISHPNRLPAALGTLQQDGSVAFHGQDILSTRVIHYSKQLPLESCHNLLNKLVRVLQQMSHSGRADFLQPTCFMISRSMLHHMGFMEHAYKHNPATIKRRLIALNSTIIMQPVSLVGARTNPTGSMWSQQSRSDVVKH